MQENTHCGLDRLATTKGKESLKAIGKTDCETASTGKRFNGLLTITKFLTRSTSI